MANFTILKALGLFVWLGLAFASLASCGLTYPALKPTSIDAANQIAAYITKNRAESQIDSDLSRAGIDTFARVFDRILRDYVRSVDKGNLLLAARNGIRDHYPQPQRIKSNKLLMAAIDGMLHSLDKHSSYLDPQELKAMQNQIKGQFGGLGIRVQKHKRGIIVVTPIAGTPASKAGIRSGDLITHANNRTLAKTSLTTAVRLLRGKAGEAINLQIERAGSSTLSLRIVRDIIKIIDIRSRLDRNVGYIQIRTFTRNISQRTQNAVTSLKAKAGRSLRGFILDLRNNPGGPLNEAVLISDMFLENGRIVSTHGRNKNIVHEANPGDIAKGLPIVILINKGSASASEIVASALQDHRRAVLIGEKSFGKGTVQQLIPLGKNDALRLTTATYLTPSGQSVDGGIEPDMTIALDPEYKGDEQFEQAIKAIYELFRDYGP